MKLKYLMPPILAVSLMFACKSEDQEYMFEVKKANDNKDTEEPESYTEPPEDTKASPALIEMDAPTNWLSALPNTLIFPEPERLCPVIRFSVPLSRMLWLVLSCI